MSDHGECYCKACYEVHGKSGDGRAWKIDRVVDRGPGHFYRYHVDGTNLFVEPGGYMREIHWDLPDLSSTAYDLTTAVWERRAA